MTISMMDEDSSGGVDLVEEADEPWALGVLTWECLKMDEEEDILEALETAQIVEGVEEVEEVKECNDKADNAKEAEMTAGLVAAMVETEEVEKSVKQGNEIFETYSLVGKILHTDSLETILSSLLSGRFRKMVEGMEKNL